MLMPKDRKIFVKKIKSLEEKCQAGIDVEENMAKIETIMLLLKPEELFEVINELEKTLKNS